MLERYSAYLRKKKEDRAQAELEPQPEQEVQKPTTNTELPIKVVPPIAETENPFGSILNDKQIELIADCINEVKMFNASVTVDDLKADTYTVNSQLYMKGQVLLKEQKVA